MILNLGDKDNLNSVLQSFQNLQQLKLYLKCLTAVHFSVIEKYYDEIYCVDKNGLQIQLNFFHVKHSTQNDDDATICRTHMQSPCG